MSGLTRTIELGSAPRPTEEANDAHDMGLLEKALRDGKCIHVAARLNAMRHQGSPVEFRGNTLGVLSIHDATAPQDAPPLATLSIDSRNKMVNLAYKVFDEDRYEQINLDPSKTSHKSLAGTMHHTLAEIARRDEPSAEIGIAGTLSSRLDGYSNLGQESRIGPPRAAKPLG